MTYFEKAAGAIPTTRRKRFGDGMLTPVRPIQFRDQYSRGIQTMLPGCDRVSTSWSGYRKHPELFRVVNRDTTPPPPVTARRSNVPNAGSSAIWRGRPGRPFRTMPLCMESATLWRSRDTARGMSQENVELVRRGFELFDHGGPRALIDADLLSSEFLFYASGAGRMISSRIRIISSLSILTPPSLSGGVFFTPSNPAVF